MEEQLQTNLTYGSLPLNFVTNVGQIDDPSVKFHLKAEQNDIFFLPNEIVFSSFEEIDGQTINVTVTSELVGADPNTEIEGLNQLPGVANFLLGNDPSQWYTEVTTYEGVLYNDLYPGIDLVFRGTEDNFTRFKRDFIVEPHADPGQIVMDFSGMEYLWIREDGALVLETVLGEFVEDAPIVYQEIGGDRHYIDAAYNLLGDGQVGFQIAEYDPNYILVIDPILQYSTYLGGSDVFSTTTEIFIDLEIVTVTETIVEVDPETGQVIEREITRQEERNIPGRTFIDTFELENAPGDDAGYTIAVDSTGAAYIAGETSAINFPQASIISPIDPSIGSDDREAFVTKIDADGEIVYSTYIGGLDRDRANGIAVDSAGSAYITGETESETFPVISRIDDPFQEFAGGSQDAFIVKLNPTGTQIDYASYLGGGGRERGVGIFVDSDEFAYITGQTNSNGLATTEVFQNEFQGGSDAFVAKVNPQGSQLEYFTYLGGSGFEEGVGIVADETGSVYLSGTTESNNLGTVGAFQTNRAGSSDAFITKLSPDGTEQIYFTYIGGSGGEVSGGIAIDNAGAAYITGITPSIDFPTTSGTFQEFYQGGEFDAFITKLNPDGSQLDYSTFIGGSGNEGINFLPQTASNIALDSAGSAYIIGTTTSTQDSASPFPITVGAEQDVSNGVTDVFITKLNPDGDALIYSSYLGGDRRDEGYGITVDETGAAYITGMTFSTPFDVALQGVDPDTGPMFAVTERLPFPTFNGFQNEDPSVQQIIVVEENPEPGAIFTELVVEVPNREDGFVAKLEFEAVLITEFGGTVNIAEGGAIDTYSLQLATQPTGNVTVSITPDNQSTVVPSFITFTPDNWEVPRLVTVTAINDTVLEGNHTSTITHSIDSADPNYDLIAIRDVVAEISDNEFGINVSPIRDLVTSESGETDEFSIVLGNVPTTNVVIPISSSDPSEGLISVNPDEEPVAEIDLTFNQLNWDIPQVVTVTGVDDDLADGDVAYAIVTSPAMSTDSNFNGINASNVQVLNLDNEVPPPDTGAGVVITESGGSTDVVEDGDTDTYTVVLLSPPNADVIVTIETDDQSATSPLELTFTPANWDIPQTVVVGAVNDQEIEGNHTSQINHSASSPDINFNNIPVDSITVSITDNAGVTIDESNNSTNISEAGLIDSYTLVLSRQPIDDVEIFVRTDSQSTADPVSLIFTPENWEIPQSVTIAAVDDLFIEETQTSTITHTVSSADPSYNGLAIADVTATIADNDLPLAGLRILESDGSTNITEGGTADTYMVVAEAPPIADVVVTISPDSQSIVTPMSNAQTNARANAISDNQSVPTTIIFTRDNWNVPQMVSVTAVDDLMMEGPHSSTITHAVRSTDANYNNMPLASVVATIDDNDTTNIINLDFDGDGRTDALTDGILGMRFLLGLTGEPLIREAIGVGASRSDANSIAAYLEQVRDTIFDIDGNGTVDAFSDGLLFVRYLFGLTGDSLIDGAIGTGATRNEASQISDFLRSFDV